MQSGKKKSILPFVAFGVLSALTITGFFALRKKKVPAFNSDGGNIPAHKGDGSLEAPIDYSEPAPNGREVAVIAEWDPRYKDGVSPFLPYYQYVPKSGSILESIESIFNDAGKKIPHTDKIVKAISYPSHNDGGDSNEHIGRWHH